MKIKVYCPCGSKFEFEVEPVNGRMPVSINCPTCGADATGLANAIIEEQSAAAPGLKISHTPAATPPPAPVSATPAQAEAEPEAQFCPKHKKDIAVETCRVCGKPICLKCMEQFGYVCSVYCRQQAAAKRISVPAYAHQKSVTDAKSRSLAKAITCSVAALVIALIGFWGWYKWFARDPKVVFTQPLVVQDPMSNKRYKPEEFYDLIGPGQLLSIKAKQASLYDVVEQRTLWTTPLQSQAEADEIKAARAQNDEIIRRTPKLHDDNGFDVTRYHGLNPLGYQDDYFFADPKIVTTTSDVWLIFYDRIARLDFKTGASKDVSVKKPIRQITLNNDTILVLSGEPTEAGSLTKITLPDGTAETEELGAPAAPAKVANVKTKGAKPGTVAKVVPSQVNQVLRQALAPNAGVGDDDFDPDSFRGQSPFVIAGGNVAQLEAKVLEQKTVSHEAMKAKKKSVLDSGNLTASQGLDVAQEMMNDSKRQETGGVEVEDVSTYQVTIHRRFAKDVPDWTGEVTGPPKLFPLKTVDVLAAGPNIIVLDKNNKKLWEAKLTFPVANSFSSEKVPAVETVDSLYFADLGMLTKFDLKTGDVKWRYNTVGISKVQVDAKGDVYLDTTTAGPESIQYSQQIDLKNQIHSLVVKVAPATGKELWRAESSGDDCIMSGKFLYTTRQKQSMAALRLEEGPDTHFFLHLLDPGNGGEIWTYHRVNQHLVKLAIQKNWIMVHFREKVVVMKFFSL